MIMRKSKSGGKSSGKNTKTRLVKPTAPAADPDAKTELPGAAPEVTPTNEPAVSIPDNSDGKTRLFVPGGRDAAEPAAEPAAEAPASTAGDPPVGWLLVVDGPGKGTALQIGYGVNAVGRGAGARIRIDFGDEQISRENQCSVTYDPKARRFFMNHGQADNLSYLNDQPALQPLQMTDRDTISVGDTRLLFVQLCGDDFEWSEI